VAFEVAAFYFYDRTRREAGVDIPYKVAIECFTGEGTVNGVRLTDGSEIPADLVVVGIGAAPNTELAAAAGLAVDYTKSTKFRRNPCVKKGGLQWRRTLMALVCRLGFRSPQQSLSHDR
jgi:hypothetical protein